MQNLNLSMQKFHLKIQKLNLTQQKLNLKMLKLKKPRKYLRKFSWIGAQKKAMTRQVEELTIGHEVDFRVGVVFFFEGAETFPLVRNS